MTVSQAAAIHVENLRFGWEPGRLVLDIPDFSVAAGERIFLHGPSGCGKSTLLALLAGVTKPDAGRITLTDNHLHQMTQGARDRFRAEHMGVIFQTFNLMPFLSVLDNVRLGFAFSKTRQKRVIRDARERGLTIESLAGRLGLGEDVMGRQVRDLSIGQQQRVAVARALLGGPQLVIADEPTSALDTQTRDRFIQLLTDECQRYGSTLVFVSHDMSLASHFDRMLDLTELNQVTARSLENNEGEAQTW